MNRIIRLVAALAVTALVAAACGDDADTGGDDARIVSLSPSVTEIVFAIGAGGDVIAVDEFSDYPADAPTTDLSGYTPNVEAIAEYDPDLVLLSGDPGGVVDGLEALDIQVLDLPAPTDIDGVYAQIEELGSVTGRVDGAAELVEAMQADIADAVESAPDAAGLGYYHELDDTLYSVTSSTFIGEIYAMYGLVNVADAADPDGALGGYPQLSEEFLVEADPDLIFLADTKCCGQTVETLTARPGWDQLTAVQSDAVVELDDDVASRWGPRVVDFVVAVRGALEAVAVPA